MHDALRNALMIEVLDLLEQNMVFQNCRTTVAGLEGIFVITDDGTYLSSHGRMLAAGELMQFAAGAGGGVGTLLSGRSGRFLGRPLGTLRLLLHDRYLAIP